MNESKGQAHSNNEACRRALTFTSFGRKLMLVHSHELHALNDLFHNVCDRSPSRCPFKFRRFRVCCGEAKAGQDLLLRTFKHAQPVHHSLCKRSSDIFASHAQCDFRIQEPLLRLFTIHLRNHLWRVAKERAVSTQQVCCLYSAPCCEH